MNIAFIGCGNMAASLIGGLIANGHAPTGIIVADPHTASTDSAAERFGVKVADNNAQAVENAQVVVLAVKPQKMQSVLEALAANLTSQLLVSIAAGITTQSLLRWSGAGNNDVAVIRCMPNTPALLQQGATGLYADPATSEDQRASAGKILASVGTVAWVNTESQLDAITALSGSGPAYFFLLIEAMTEAAIALGIDQNTARQFAAQTALGAAQMASESDQPPARLRQNVTSPGGTTEAALNSFNDNNFKQIVLNAMQAAEQRAQVLGKKTGDSNG